LAGRRHWHEAASVARTAASRGLPALPRRPPVW